MRSIPLVLLLLVLGGCGCPPLPPEPVNARLPDHAAIYVDRPGAGDVVVVGRCTSSTEYAVTSQGDWNHHWYLVRVELLVVEKGRWDDSRGLTFIAVDGWPKPESGIVLDKAPWPYRTGRVYAFTLSTASKPPLVAGQEHRSLVDP